MQDYFVYQIGSLKIRMNQRIKYLDKYYLTLVNGEYDWVFEVKVSKNQIDHIIHNAKSPNIRDNIIYINDDCIYEMDISRKKSICYCANLLEFEASFIGAPIQVVALYCNKVCLHCSGIIHNKEIILFSGNSGVGKSTLMYNIRGDDFELFCDDMCMVEKGGNDYTAFCIETFIKLYKNQIGNAKDIIKANEDKYLVPIDYFGKSIQRTPYRLNRILFLSRYESKDFYIKKINSPSQKYILCAQSIIFFNERTPLITEKMRKYFIETIKNIDMGVLFVPNMIENCDYNSLKKLLDL